MTTPERSGWQRFAPFISDGISLAILLFSLAVTWGKFDERLANLEKKDTADEIRAQQMKQDLQRELDGIRRTLERIDDRMDRQARK